MSEQELSEAQIEALVDRVAGRIQRHLQMKVVPPNPELRGTWQDQTGLKQLVTAGADRIGTDGAPETNPELAKYIDHTLLKPTATRVDIVRMCDEAMKYGFASVCLNTTWIPLAAKLLKDSRVMPIAVVGFPLGAMVTSAKALETEQAIKDGAEEIDMVINIGQLKSSSHNAVYDDIKAVVTAAQGRPVKVILETCMLTRDEIIAGSAISKSAGAAFVKTSTGFGGGGATAEHVALMRSVVGSDIGVKASGGMKNAADARAMIAAGANRLGASAGIAIVSGGTGGSGY